MEDCSNCSLSMSLIQNKLVIIESSHSRECRERNIEYRQNYQKRRLYYKGVRSLSWKLAGLK